MTLGKDWDGGVIERTYTFHWHVGIFFVCLFFDNENEFIYWLKSQKQLLWKTVVTPQKLKHTRTIGASNSTPTYIPKGTENTSTHNLHTNVDRRTIHNDPKVEMNIIWSLKRNEILIQATS